MKELYSVDKDTVADINDITKLRVCLLKEIKEI
jgi:hypothetical protein